MILEEDVRAWMRTHALSDIAIKTVLHIFKTAPVREVGCGKQNVHGRYASPLMERVLQFESHTCECAFLNLKHSDPGTFLLLDQVLSVRLQYENKTGRLSVDIVVDFLLLAHGKAVLVDCKKTEELEEYAKKGKGDDGRFYHDPESGRWRSKCGEAAAKALGLEFLVFSPRDITEARLANTNFLEDYYRPNSEPPNLERLTLEIEGKIPAVGGVRLNELISSGTDEATDVLYYQIAKGRFFVDLDNEFITPNYLARVFKSKEYFELSQIVGGGGAIADVAARPGVKLFNDAGPERQMVAVKKYLTVNRFLEKSGGRLRCSKTRTERRRVSDYNTAELMLGCGLAGLLEEIRPGNTSPRQDPRTAIIVDDVLENYYKSVTAPSIEITWGECMRRCKEAVPPAPAPSRNYVTSKIADLDSADATRARQGSRAAYDYSLQMWSDEMQLSNPNGENAWGVGHIDHTLVDLQTDGGRFWLTVLFLPLSRRVVGRCYSRRAPSAAVCMQVLRDCVRRFKRLPRYIVTDNGIEFKSALYQTVLALYGIHIKYRPPGRARFGAALERFLGSATTTIIHNLSGNTKYMVLVRKLSSTHLPEKHTPWTFFAAGEVLDEYLFVQYDEAKRDALNGNSPKSAYDLQMKMGGPRSSQVIAYDREFEIMTSPTGRKGRVTIRARDGVRIDGNSYWNSEFSYSENHNISVTYRYVPEDPSLVYVYLNGDWRDCYSKKLKLDLRDIKGIDRLYYALYLSVSSGSREGNRRVNAISAAEFVNRVQKNRQTEIAEASEAQVIDVEAAPVADSQLPASELNKQASSDLPAINQGQVDTKGAASMAVGGYGFVLTRKKKMYDAEII